MNVKRNELFPESKYLAKVNEAKPSIIFNDRGIVFAIVLELSREARSQIKFSESSLLELEFDDIRLSIPI